MTELIELIYVNFNYIFSLINNFTIIQLYNSVFKTMFFMYKENNVDYVDRVD